jgi:hypothetical protein
LAGTWIKSLEPGFIGFKDFQDLFLRIEIVFVYIKPEDNL